VRVECGQRAVSARNAKKGERSPPWQATANPSEAQGVLESSEAEETHEVGPDGAAEGGAEPDESDLGSEVTVLSVGDVCGD